MFLHLIAMFMFLHLIAMFCFLVVGAFLLAMAIMQTLGIRLHGHGFCEECGARQWQCHCKDSPS